jgi:hypothetical protein
MLGSQTSASRIRLSVLAFGSAVLTTGLLGVAVPALASEPCPNEAIREQQGVTYLPDCRAFEQVTPAHKGADNAVFEGATADGSHVSFDAPGGLLGTAESSERHVFGAGRTSSGWSTLSLTPFDQPSSPQQFSFIPGSEDPSRVTFITNAPLVPQDTNTAPDLYQAVNGHVTLLSHDASGQAIGTMLETVRATYIVTPDGQHVFFPSSQALTPGATDGQQNIYEADSAGNVSLVSQTTAGGEPANPENYSGGAEVGNGLNNFADAVSSDGSTVFFTSALQFDPSVPDDGVKKLFMRRDGVTTVVSASETATPAVSPVRYEGAAADGSQVFFSTPDPLTSDDQNTVPDIYRYTTATGALTRVSGGNPGFNDNVTGVDVNNGGGVVAISADGSHVYFVTPDQLTAQAPAGDSSGPLLYEWTPAGTTYIATLSPDDVNGYESTTGSHFFFVPLTSEVQADRAARTTPDGTHLVFESHANLTPDDTNDTQDVYEWSDSGGLVRVSQGSINSTGPALYDATIGSPVANLVGGDGQPARDYDTGAEENIFGRVVSDDGSRVFFSTKNALTPEAIEGVRNIYEYEDGHTMLVSPGGAAATDAFYQDSSSDGSDVFFTTLQSLVPGDDDGGATDVYDSRVGGGFLEVPAAAAGCAQSNTCPAAPLVTPGEPVSALFVLPGNPAPSPSATASKGPPKAIPLTRAQKLAKALRACAKKRKRQRASCVKQAHKQYAARSKAKKSDRSGH